MARILAALGARTFALVSCPDVALAFLFLLAGGATGFLAGRAGAIVALLALAVILGGARLAERDGDCLLAAFYLAALAAAAAFQFAMLELVHHASFGAALARGRFGHVFPPCSRNCLGNGAFAKRLRSGFVMPSSVIRNFRYLPRERQLEIVFVTGRRYLYLEVPEKT